MARPQAADYDQRREEILTRAAALFARRGFAGTSVADIASACETSKSLIYHYFGSKEEILDAVMLGHIDLLTSATERALAVPGDPETQLRDLVRCFMVHYVGAADRQKVLLNELDRLPPARRDAIVREQRAIVDAVAGLLGRIGKDQGQDPARTRVHAMLLFGMINWTHTWFDPAGPVNAAELADQAVDLAIGRQAS